MSELINNPGQGKHILWQLLSTASALALIGAVGVGSKAKASEDDRPTVWIELGGALQRLDTGEEKYAPPFLFETPRPNGQTVDPLSIGHLPRSAFEADGKIVFQPEDFKLEFHRRRPFWPDEGASISSSASPLYRAAVHGGNRSCLSAGVPVR